MGTVCAIMDPCCVKARALAVRFKTIFFTHYPFFRANFFNFSIKLFLRLIAPFLPTLAFAASGSPIDVDQMLANIQEQLPYLTEFVTALCYLSGVYFIFKAMYALKQYGEMRTMMASGTDLRGPITQIGLAVCLLFSPTIIDVGLTTFYGDSSILAYDETGTEWDTLANTIIAIVQFVGGVAFLRGIFIFHKLGSGQAQPGTFAKGVTHLIGGVIALNIVQATKILYDTLGIDWS